MATPPRRIGILVSCLHEPYQARIYAPLVAQARRRGVETHTFVATSQDDVDTLIEHYDQVTAFLHHASLDGLICLGGAIENHRGAAFAESLYGRLPAIPTVLVSSRSTRFPCVLVDNYGGMVSLVHHLVTVHGRRAIAFVSGPRGAVEAEERLAGYRAGLEQLDLPWDPRRVLPGNFDAEDGRRAVESLRASGVAFDAIIGADDLTATGILRGLRAAGLSVPHDVAVAGFDDDAVAAGCIPPLTTVSQPWEQLARTALDIAQAAIDGREVAPVTTLQPSVLHRRSCGCLPAVVRDTARRSSAAPRAPAEDITAWAHRIAHPEIPDEATIAWLAAAHDSFRRALVDPQSADSWWHHLDRVFVELADAGKRLDAFIDFLGATADTAVAESPPAQQAAARTLLQQTYALLRAYTAAFHEDRHQSELSYQNAVRDCARAIISALDDTHLRRRIAHKLPALGIPRFAVTVFDAPMTAAQPTRVPAYAHLFAASARGAAILADDEPPLSGTTTIPPDLLDDTPGQWISMPVFFEDECFGMITFDHQDAIPLFTYEDLRIHLGSALRATRLVGALRKESVQDPLTGLLNRRGFAHAAHHMMQRARHDGTELLFFFADMDHLKTINDTFGHEEGDTAIAAAARILQETFRRGDVIGRIGGDEFCVVMAVDADCEPTERLLARLEHTTAAVNAALNKPYRVSLTVGSSTCAPDDPRTFDDILKEADARLLAKKRNRR